MDKLSLQISFGTLLPKLVNDNKNDWDKHLSIVLFSYWIAYKVGTSHTPFQLFMGYIHKLPIKYILPFKPSENKGPKLVKVLTSRLYEINTKYKK